MSTLEILEAHVQSVRNQSCSCGWRPTKVTLYDNAGMQHRRHLAEELAAALPPRPPAVPSCPERLMDGRNEIRCWLPAGHDGDHK